MDDFTNPTLTQRMDDVPEVKRKRLEGRTGITPKDIFDKTPIGESYTKFEKSREARERGDFEEAEKLKKEAMVQGAVAVAGFAISVVGQGALGLASKKFGGYILKTVKEAFKGAAGGPPPPLPSKDRVFIPVRELYRLNGHWKGSKYSVQYMLVDQDGNMAGCGEDSSRPYTVSGKIKNDGTFSFDKQYADDPDNRITYSGSVEWNNQNQPLQGNWSLDGPEVTELFEVIPDGVRLEVSVIILCCCSVQEALGMTDKLKREKIINALFDRVSVEVESKSREGQTESESGFAETKDVSAKVAKDEFASLPDEVLVKIVRFFTTGEL